MIEEGEVEKWLVEVESEGGGVMVLEVNGLRNAGEGRKGWRVRYRKGLC